MSAVDVEPLCLGVETLGVLSPLFRYPAEGYARALDFARVFETEIDAAAGSALARFAAEIEPLSRGQLESTYTHTFDLAPSCSPYLGAHLFGDETPDRARLMVGLRMTYRNHGIDVDGRELPDHVAEVLEHARCFEGAEWFELGRLILIPALDRMTAILESTTNPYRHLLDATRRVARTLFEEGGLS
ncbi:MAG: nitrate reductase molybdenum cofactor assembly chaperone [Thermoanaerobaculia bacterium]